MIDINVVNDKLNEGLSVKEIREQLSIGEKKFQKEIKELGYKYNQKLKKYVKGSEEAQREVLNTSMTNYSNDKDKDLTSKNNKEYDNSLTIDIPENMIEADTFKSNLIDLVLNYDKIKKMMYDYEHTSDIQNVIEVQQQGIKIDKPDGNIIRTTIRINEEILNIFKSFCDKNKEYTQKDLLGQALLEFVRKYDK